MLHIFCQRLCESTEESGCDTWFHQRRIRAGFFFFSFNFENYGVMAFCKLSVFQPTTVSILSNTEIILMLCNKGSLPDMTIL
jgi:hypothetical protein